MFHIRDVIGGVVKFLQIGFWEIYISLFDIRLFIISFSYCCQRSMADYPGRKSADAWRLEGNVCCKEGRYVQAIEWL